MRVEINSKNYEISDDLRKYVTKKLTKISRIMNKHQKQSAHAIVMLKEQSGKANDKYEAEIILRLPPKEELIAKDKAMNMFAAVDIVEEKIKSQLRKYKSKHADNKADRKGVMARMRRRVDREFKNRQN